MLETALAQMRFAASLVFGIRFSLSSLDCLIDSLRDTQREFGRINTKEVALLDSPMLDEGTCRAMQLRRFRAQSIRAARETAYYSRLFECLDLDPTQLNTEKIIHLPLTTKEELRADPDAFVCRTARPNLRAMTTGTTGQPISICFSEHELRLYCALSALSALASCNLDAMDIVQISTSSRGTLGNICFAGTCVHLGATAYLTGLVEPTHALLLLSERRHLAGRKPRTSVLYTYPSYLGELVECGLLRGYRPADFSLERIIIGGEIVTAGLKVRCQELFGPVQYIEGYGITEIWPFGGRLCEADHQHFEASQGLLEVLDYETGTPTLPGEMGTIVATPFPQYRETTMVLRYDTQDVVRAVTGPLSCSLRHLPATSNLFGKLSLSVHHERGWTFPREIAEALEALEEVPLPARYGFWAVPGGVEVEVVTRHDTSSVWHKVKTSLEEHGVSVCQLRLLAHQCQLQHPMPLRGDLKEQTFSRSMQDAIC